jgi:hypothetical protein
MPIEGFTDKKTYYEENESLSKNTHMNKQTNINMKDKQKFTKIE